MQSYQLNKLLDENNAYMQRARQSGLDLATQRGLGNSSIAAGNAMAAAIDRAAPIAGFDATRYGTVANMNMDAQNRASLQAASQAHSASMASASQAHAAAMQQAAHQNSMQGMMFGHGLGGVDDYRRHLLGMETREDDQAFRAGQADIDRYMQQNQFDQTMGLNRDEFNSGNYWRGQDNQFRYDTFGADNYWREQDNQFRWGQSDRDFYRDMAGMRAGLMTNTLGNPNMEAAQQAASWAQVRENLAGMGPEMWNQWSDMGLVSPYAGQAAAGLPPLPPIRSGGRGGQP